MATARPCGARGEPRGDHLRRNERCLPRNHPRPGWQEDQTFALPAQGSTRGPDLGTEGDARDPQPHPAGPTSTSAAVGAVSGTQSPPWCRRCSVQAARLRWDPVLEDGPAVCLAGPRPDPGTPRRTCRDLAARWNRTPPTRNSPPSAVTATNTARATPRPAGRS